MAKAFSDFLRRGEDREKVPQDVKKILSRDNACYVLIACEQPNEEGKMNVEMTYKGDACLAAYLIESAQNFIYEEDDSH